MKYSLSGDHDISVSATRRDLLKAGAGLAAAVSAPAVAAPALAQTAINLPRAPNLIVLMTDQERHHMHGLPTLGGGNPNNDGRYGNPNNDGRYIEGVEPGARGQTPGFGESLIDFLQDRAPKLGKPFCLFISLVNPHDVWAYPGVWKKAGYRYEDFANLDIELPPNYADDLLTKPAVQRAARAAYDLLAPLPTDVAEREYVRFYAYLNKLVDGHIVKVLDTLEETGLMDKTIIVRMADHGEGGLSHGMRE